jgi:hypothetical protein
MSSIFSCSVGRKNISNFEFDFSATEFGHPNPILTFFYYEDEGKSFLQEHARYEASSVKYVVMKS